ncbi:MAG: hypothetical protein CL528_13300 [Aequorivita sp.]|nr:hypothetical protein [Aequorivita sp.]
MAWTPRQPRIDYSAADAVRELSTLMLTMAFQQQERREEREWQESQTYLAANLNELTRVRTAEGELRKEARDIGVLGIALNKIPKEVHTAAGLEITREKKDSIDSAIEATENISTAIEQNISAFNRGANMAADMDTDKPYGRVELEELTSWISKEQEKKGVDWIPSESFKMGVKSYTYDPTRRVALERADIQLQTEEELFKWVSKEAAHKYRIGELTEEQALEAIEVSKATRRLQAIEEKKEELKLDFLPEQLKVEEEMREITLETGYLSLDKLEVDTNNARIAGKTAILGMEHTKTQIALTNLAIESADFELDKKVRDDTIASIEKALIDNMVYQSDIGSMLLTDIAVLDDDENLISLSVAYTTMAADPIAGLKMLTDLDDKYSLIQNDIIRLVSSVQKGKEEEMLPDYSLFLKEIGKIKGLYDEWRLFRRNSKDKIEAYLIEHRYASEMEAIMAVAELDPNTNSLNIAKAIQWNDTGVFDNLTSLGAAVDVMEQMKDLNDARDITRNLDIGYMQREAFPIYTNSTEADTSNIDKLFQSIIYPMGFKSNPNK